jgi:hypothetical protein
MAIMDPALALDALTAVYSKNAPVYDAVGIVYIVLLPTGVVVFVVVFNDGAI